MTNKLIKLVDDAYKVFENYRILIPLNICRECCVSKEQEQALLKTPLRKIPRDLLETYNHSARIFEPVAQEFKYFLPRYLELISLLEFPSHSIELSLSLMDLSKVNEWTTGEINFIHNFAAEFFSFYLSDFPRNGSVDSILIMFGIAHIDINNLLKTWENCSSIESILHFSDFLYNQINYNKNQLQNSFKRYLPDPQQFSENILNWLAKSKVHEHFSKHTENIIINGLIKNEKKLYELNWVYEILQK